MKGLGSIGAIVAGILVVVVPSIGTDMMMNAIGPFPSPGGSMSNGLLLLATAYRTVYGVLGSSVAAWLAPSRPMKHALVLGLIGLVASIAGAVANWDQGHAWYPLALVVLALPQAWIGGRLRELQQKA